MKSLAERPDADLREWCQEILQNLGEMLSVTKRDDVRRRFQVLGKTRFEENIPLHEAVLRFHLLKNKIVEYIHEQGFPMNAMQLYAEEELGQRIGYFFDASVYQVVRGYEHALRRASRMAS
ncbi:MAG TPA: hypothetical protein VG456_13050 [Candidatus Sulfopaludibacter sp.]|nr:hypothetical protein [Candidatus Sulfopaludibacter sp.]